MPERSDDRPSLAELRRQRKQRVAAMNELPFVHIPDVLDPVAVRMAQSALRFRETRKAELRG